MTKLFIVLLTLPIVRKTHNLKFLKKRLKEQGLVKYDLKEDLINCKDVFCTAVKGIIGNYSGINIDDLNEHKNAETLKIPKIKTLTEYQELKQVLSDFKTGLKEIISNLNDRNIYIFVDELERCRPIFAIELLEAIKHLFNVKGLVFILGIDRSQLKHTISNIYGCGMDGEGYLRRFIDLELELPKPDIKIFTNYLQQKFEIKNNLENTNQNWVIGYNEFNRYFNIFASLYPLHLREIEQIYAKFNVITKMLDENVIKITPILALLIILKVKDRKLYDEFILSNLTLEKADSFLNQNIFFKLQNLSNTDRIYLEHVKKICIAMQQINYTEKSYDIEDKKMKAYFLELSDLQRSIHSFNTDRIQYLKNMISYINVA